jgi:Sec-independent protein translocase protein TatA
MGISLGFVSVLGLGLLLVLVIVLLVFGTRK